MKKFSSISTITGVLLFSISLWSCSESPISTDLSNSALYLDTLSIVDIQGQNYRLAPNIGSNEKLYLGLKNGLNIPFSFISIQNSSYWNLFFDSTITVDSLHFVLYSKDSLLSNSSTPNLYFSPDSQFNENSSTYLDYPGLTFVDWTDMGQGLVNINTDTSGLFTKTELIWKLDPLISALTDTLDSSLHRSFAVELTNSDTSFMELFSSEASSGDKDPKIIIYLRDSTVVSEDSVSIDTLSVTVYSNGDLSVIDPTSSAVDSANLILSNGLGIRAVFNFPFISGLIPAGSIIRSAILSLPIDTIKSASPYTIILDPIDSVSVDTIDVLISDPYIGIGYPYRVSNVLEPDSISNGLFTISVKNILQNISLGNEENIGFKMVSDQNNDPFQSVWFNPEEDSRKPKLEIIYVAQ